MEYHIEPELMTACEPGEKYGDGYVMIHRGLMNHRYFQNEKLLKFYLWCIMKATWQDYKALVGLKTVELKRGEFIFGRKEAAKQLNMTERNIRTLLELLKKRSKIDHQNDQQIFSNFSNKL